MTRPIVLALVAPILALVWVLLIGVGLLLGVASWLVWSSGQNAGKSWLRWFREFVHPRIVFFEQMAAALLFPDWFRCPCGECTPDARFTLLRRQDVPDPTEERILQ